MISGYELNYNVLNNKEFLYDYISKIKHRINFFENKILQHEDEVSSNPKYFDQKLIYNDFINNYKEELTFIYKQMKEFLLKKVDDLDNKYIKSLFKKICITYNIKDSVTIKHMAEEYKKVYGWITMTDIKKLLDHFKLDPKCLLILNEAIVEFWATIIHLSNVSKEYNISFDELLKIELEYSLYKSNQILNLKLKSNLNLHYDNCNIYAYIIFKTIFFYHFNEFVKIYTFPYNNKKIVDFLITHSNLRKVTINPSYIFKGKKIQRPSNSLCFMSWGHQTWEFI